MLNITYLVTHKPIFRPSLSRNTTIHPLRINTRMGTKLASIFHSRNRAAKRTSDLHFVLLCARRALRPIVSERQSTVGCAAKRIETDDRLVLYEFLGVIENAVRKDARSNSARFLKPPERKFSRRRRRSRNDASIDREKDADADGERYMLPPIKTRPRRWLGLGPGRLPPRIDRA